MDLQLSCRSFVKGDWVVYCKTKFTPHPGRRAREIRAAANGDNYCYSVDKFWVVANVFPDGKLLLQTRRGKKHVVDANDMKLGVQLYGIACAIVPASNGFSSRMTSSDSMRAWTASRLFRPVARRSAARKRKPRGGGTAGLEHFSKLRSGRVCHCWLVQQCSTRHGWTSHPWHPIYRSETRSRS